MKIGSKIFGMASLAMGLYGCAEVANMKSEGMTSNVTDLPTQTKCTIDPIGERVLKVEEPKLTKGIDTPIAKAIVENKMEEQRQQQVVADAQAKFLYEQKKAEEVPVPVEEAITPAPVEEVISPVPVQEEVITPVEEIQPPVQEETTPPIEEIQPPAQEEVIPPVEEIQPPVQEEVIAPIEESQPPVQEEVVETPTLSDRIAQEGLALVGNTEGMQCTEFVSQAMTNATVENVQVLWPDEYFIYGEYTESPVAGDLIYYNAGERGKDHIAIYLDDQTALHGNWNGTTEKAENSVIGQLDLGIPMQFIHVES